VEGYWCFRKWVQGSPCIGSAKCGLIASNERDVQNFLSLQGLLARLLSRHRSRRVCVHLYTHYVCMYAYVCMCADMYICIYMHVYMYLYTESMRLYTCVCVCVCIFVHRLRVLVSVLQRVDSVMHAHVFSCAYVCVYVYVWVYTYVHFFVVSVKCTLQVF